MRDKLELRMYGFVPYNISEIQKAIQFGHAVVEYGQMCKKEDIVLENNYNDWADNWKTFIILNGGTSNHIDPEYVGSMETIVDDLKENNIVFSTFNEPDLNDMLSAIVFIVDERVFNRKKYLDFGDWVLENHFMYLQDNMIDSRKIERMRKDGYFLTASENERKIYLQWVDYIGDEKNVFLRDYLNPNRVKLA